MQEDYSCDSLKLNNKRRRRNSSKPSPNNRQALKKPNFRQIGEPLDMVSGGPQLPTVSISEDDIAKIAIAVKQMFVHEFNNIIDEKQKPIIDEIAKLKQDFSILVRQCKNEIHHLKDKCDELEMHSRKQCVRFSGVPITPDENTDTKIIEMASELGVTIQPSDIMISHRTGKNNPRQIIARIPNHSLKKKLLKSSKLLKDKPELHGISINQDFASVRSRLAYQARQLVKQRKIKSTFLSMARSTYSIVTMGDT